MCAFAKFRPLSWFWLKPLSLKRPTSETRPALYPACGAAAPGPTNETATTVIAASAATGARKRTFFTEPSWLVRPADRGEPMLVRHPDVFYSLKRREPQEVVGSRDDCLALGIRRLRQPGRHELLAALENLRPGLGILPAALEKLL